MAAAGEREAQEQERAKQRERGDAGAVELDTNDSTAEGADTGDDNIEDEKSSDASGVTHAVGSCWRRRSFRRDGEGKMQGELAGARVDL